ncbi:MAG: phosphatase PAP2-related protein [Planctomycetota bacterium]|nr:phosphatase PAP2-related protein [Planctomycetota bacterium]
MTKKRGLLGWVGRGMILLLLALLWFGSQHLISNSKGNESASSVIGDRVLEGTEGINRYLREHRSVASALLILSSLELDLFVLWIGWMMLRGGTVRPILGLTVLVVLRQLCQMLVVLPVPQGILWYDPGVPSLIQTYGISNDLFFSGHTALCTFGTLCWVHRYPELWKRWVGKGLAVIGIVFPVAVVLVLRAHYFMDVYAGFVTACLVEHWSRRCLLPNWIALDEDMS